MWEPLSHLLFINFYNAFFDFVFLPLPKEQGEKGKERRGKYFCLFALCLLPCLPLAFGFFLIFPESKSFKHLKLYMLIKK